MLNALWLYYAIRNVVNVATYGANAHIHNTGRLRLG
jgi:hypothetical protein